MPLSVRLRHATDKYWLRHTKTNGLRLSGSPITLWCMFYTNLWAKSCCLISSSTESGGQIDGCNYWFGLEDGYLTFKFGSGGQLNVWRAFAVPHIAGYTQSQGRIWYQRWLLAAVSYTPGGEPELWMGLVPWMGLYDSSAPGTARLYYQRGYWSSGGAETPIDDGAESVRVGADALGNFLCHPEEIYYGGNLVCYGILAEHAFSRDDCDGKEAFRGTNVEYFNQPQFIEDMERWASVPASHRLFVFIESPTTDNPRVFTDHSGDHNNGQFMINDTPSAAPGDVWPPDETAICIHLIEGSVDPSLGSSGVRADIQCHAAHHWWLAQRTPDEIRAEYRAVDDEFRRRGLSPPKHTAYPNGSYNDVVKRITAEFRLTGRTAKAGPFAGVNPYPISDWYELYSIEIGQEPNRNASAKAYIDKMATIPGLYILYAHGVQKYPFQPYHCTPEGFSEVLDYALAAGVMICDLNQAYQRIQAGGGSYSRSILVFTFDDQYPGALNYAHKLLAKKAGVGGTHYICTSTMLLSRIPFERSRWDDVCAAAGLPVGHCVVSFKQNGRPKTGLTPRVTGPEFNYANAERITEDDGPVVYAPMQGFTELGYGSYAMPYCRNKTARFKVHSFDFSMAPEERVLDVVSPPSTASFVLIDFDDLPHKVPGVAVTDQYADVGVVFHNAWTHCFTTETAPPAPNGLKAAPGSGLPGGTIRADIIDPYLRSSRTTNFVQIALKGAADAGESRVLAYGSRGELLATLGPARAGETVVIQQPGVAFVDITLGEGVACSQFIFQQLAFLEPRIIGDVNGDELVNVTDLLIVRNNMGASGTAINPPYADVNRDGLVNVTDLLIVRNHIVTGPRK